MPTTTDRACARPAQDRTTTTRLSVAPSPSGPVMRSAGGPFRAVLQQRTDTAVRVALVPDRALLLAGDDVGLLIEVGPRVALHLVEASGTVAYDMRGGSARWRVRAELGDGAHLTHETLPWVSAQGSDVVRDLRLDLTGRATALLRETLVLGRHGERPGALRSRTQVQRDGVPVLVEDLDAADLAPHRVLDSVLAFGLDPLPPRSEEADRPRATRLITAWGDVVHRALAGAAHESAAALDEAWRHYPSCAAGPPPGA